MTIDDGEVHNIRLNRKSTLKEAISRCKIQLTNFAKIRYRQGSKVIVVNASEIINRPLEQVFGD